MWPICIFSSKHYFQFRTLALLLALVYGAAADKVLKPRLQGPALVQHQDGRLFVVNAHLKPGQLFRSQDGRVFALANDKAVERTNQEVRTQNNPSPAAAPSAYLAPVVDQAKLAGIRTEQEIRKQNSPSTPVIPSFFSPPLADDNKLAGKRTQEELRFQNVPVFANYLSPAVPNSQQVRQLPVKDRPGEVSQVHALPFQVVAAKESSTSTNTRNQDGQNAIVTGYFSFPSAGFDFNF